MSDCCQGNCNCDNQPSYSFEGETPPAPDKCCTPTTVPSIPVEEGEVITTNQGEVIELILLGRVGNRLVRFPDEANGFIRINDGKATVESSFPILLNTFLHQIATDPESAPLNAPLEVVANASGNLRLQAGLKDISSIRYWDGSINEYKTVPLYNFPSCMEGCIEKVECIEITGFDASETPENDTVRKRVALKGSGIVVIEDEENLENPAKPLSKSRAVTVPEDLTSQAYVLSWSGAGGYVWQQLTVLNGTDGVSPIINGDGNWEIGGVDTGVPAQGPQGIPGDSPFINPAGNWQVGGVDTGINASGIQGLPGTPGVPGADGTVVTIEDGKWHLDGVDTGVFADIGAATISETTTSVDTSESYTAQITAAQNVDPATETALTIQGAGSSGKITHTNGNTIFGIGTDVARVEIDLSLFCSAIAAAGDQGIFRLYKGFGVAPVLLAQVTIKDANEAASLKYIDKNPADGTVYAITGQSLAGNPNGITFTTNQLSIKATSKVDVVTGFTLT